MSSRSWFIAAVPALIVCSGAPSARAARFEPIWGPGFSENTPLAASRRGVVNSVLSDFERTITGNNDAVIQVRVQFVGQGGGGPLAVSLPSGYADGFPGQPHADSAYPFALANVIENRDRNANTPELQIDFNSDKSWYYGTTGYPTEQFMFDMRSVCIHEVFHGLGVLTSLNPAGDKWGQDNTSAADKQNIFDRFLRNADGNPFTGPGQPVAIPAGTVTNTVTWAGANAAKANGQGRPAPTLYTPGNYQPGKSLVHTDPSLYWGAWGTISPEHLDRSGKMMISPIAQGILMDMGYTGVKTIQRFWNSDTVNGDWTTAANWWDPDNPATGKVPQPGEHVVIQQPRLARATDATIEVNTTAGVNIVTNLSTLRIKTNGNLDTGGGLNNGGVVELTGGGKLQAFFVDNAHNARLNPRFIPDPNTPGGLIPEFAAPPTIRITGNGSRLTSRNIVTNSGYVNISDKGAWISEHRFRNGYEIFQNAATNGDITIRGQGLLKICSDLENGNVGIISIEDRRSRIVLYDRGPVDVPFGTLQNTGTVTLNHGGQFGAARAENLYDINVFGGGNGDELNASLFWVKEFENGSEGENARRGTVVVQEDNTQLRYRAELQVVGTLTNYPDSLITTKGKATIHYKKLDNRGETNFAPGTSPDGSRGATLDSMPLAWGGDVINHGTAVVAGPGQIHTYGSFINYSLRPTLWQTRETTLGFVPSPDASVQTLRTNSVELTDPTSQYAGGRLYTDRLFMASTPPALPAFSDAPSEEDDAAPRAASLFSFRSGGIPTLDIFGGVIYLLDHPLNGLADLVAMINAGQASIFDSLDQTRPAYLPFDPSRRGIIQLVPGTPGSSGLGFTDNFAFGSVEIYGGSFVRLDVPAPGSAVFAGLFGLFASRRRR